MVCLFPLFMVLNFNAVKFINFNALWLVIYKIFAYLKNMDISSAFFLKAFMCQLSHLDLYSIWIFYRAWSGGYGVQ